MEFVTKVYLQGGDFLSGELRKEEGGSRTYSNFHVGEVHESYIAFLTLVRYI
jgi:hypothetical protein